MYKLDLVNWLYSSWTPAPGCWGQQLWWAIKKDKVEVWLRDEEFEVDTHNYQLSIWLWSLKEEQAEGIELKAEYDAYEKAGPDDTAYDAHGAWGMSKKGGPRILDG